MPLFEYWQETKPARARSHRCIKWQKDADYSQFFQQFSRTPHYKIHLFYDIIIAEKSQSDKDIKFHTKIDGNMSEQMFMFAVTTGIFVFLAAVLFGARAKRYGSGYTPAEGHASTASS